MSFRLVLSQVILFNRIALLSIIFFSCPVKNCPGPVQRFLQTLRRINHQAFRQLSRLWRIKSSVFTSKNPFFRAYPAGRLPFPWNPFWTAEAGCISIFILSLSYRLPAGTYASSQGQNSRSVSTPVHSLAKNESNLFPHRIK